MVPIAPTWPNMSRIWPKDWPTSVPTWFRIRHFGTETEREGERERERQGDREIVGQIQTERQ
jgi:hypothetical protein